MSYPPFGTSLIKCGRRSCDWRGKETDLATLAADVGKFAVRKGCPKCQCTSYSFVRRKGTSQQSVNAETSESA